jgi:hypothetical protein
MKGPRYDLEQFKTSLSEALSLPSSNEFRNVQLTIEGPYNDKQREKIGHLLSLTPEQKAKIKIVEWKLSTNGTTLVNFRKDLENALEIATQDQAIKMKIDGLHEEENRVKLIYLTKLSPENRKKIKVDKSELSDDDKKTYATIDSARIEVLKDESKKDQWKSTIRADLRRIRDNEKNSKFLFNFKEVHSNPDVLSTLFEEINLLSKGYPDENGKATEASHTFTHIEVLFD